MDKPANSIQFTFEKAIIILVAGHVVSVHAKVLCSSAVHSRPRRAGHPETMSNHVSFMH